MPPRGPFPPLPLEEALQIPRVIAQKNSGRPMRRLDVFEELGKSPDSGPSRSLVTASSAFGLTVGSYKADFLQLTEIGKRCAVLEDKSALVDAVLQVDAFKRFFEAYKNSALPSPTAARSFLAEQGIPAERTESCLQSLLQSGRFAGLIQEMSGAERVLSPEHAVSRLAPSVPTSAAPPAPKSEEKDSRVSEGKIAGRLPPLHINLEIHIPGDAAPEKYDAIFSSMRKHLIDAG